MKGINQEASMYTIPELFYSSSLWEYNCNLKLNVYCHLSSEPEWAKPQNKVCENNERFDVV